MVGLPPKALAPPPKVGLDPNPEPNADGFPKEAAAPNPPAPAPAPAEKGPEGDPNAGLASGDAGVAVKGLLAPKTEVGLLPKRP